MSRERIDNVPASAALMVIGAAFFITVAALVKRATDLDATSMQGVLYRSVFSALPLLVLMRVRGVPVCSPRRGLLFLRGAIGFLALSCYLWAVAHVPLADVMSLQQLNPIFVAFLSIWLLRERPRASHYVLAGLCLVGALLVIRPTRGVASLDSTAALLSALFSSGAYVTVRALTRTEATSRIVVWFSGTAALLALPLVIPGWRWLSLEANLLLVGAGFAAAVAQSLMTAAYRHAPAHITATFSYASVPLAYVVGLILWEEKPDLWANIGIGLIVIGGVVIVYSVRPRLRA